MIRTTSRFPTTLADCSIEVLVGQQQVYVSRGGAVEIGLMDGPMVVQGWYTPAGNCPISPSQPALFE